MRRALHLLAVIAIFSAVALGAMLALQALGHTAYDVADISGKAIMAAELRGRIEDVITAYPPLPLLASLPFAFFRPWDIPPALLCAIVLGAFSAPRFITPSEASRHRASSRSLPPCSWC